MPRKLFLLLAGGAAAAVLAALSGRLPGLLAGLLLCGACAVGGGCALLLAPPLWSARRQRVRVRYHAADPAEVDGARLGAGLLALARLSGWVDVVWRRTGGDLTLELEVGPVAEELLQGLIAQVLPDGTLEPLTGPLPPLPEPLGRWSLDSRDPLPPLFGDPGVLLAETLLVGDFELRLHLTADGGALLAAGTSAPAAGRQGYRRWLLPRALGAWLLRHYRLWEPWPDDGPPVLRFPATAGPGTARLDVHQSVAVPLPPTYTLPPGDCPLILLGRATVDGQPVGIRAGDPATWGRHLLAIGPEEATTATIAGLLEQAAAQGVGVVRIRLPARQAGRDGRGPDGTAVQIIDLSQPGISPHWNLLAVPPLGTGPVAEMNALRMALATRVPLLGACLAQWGLLAHSSGTGWTLLLDAARAALITHHRRRLLGQEERGTAPTLPLLQALLTNPTALPALITAECVAWTDPNLRPVLETAPAAEVELTEYVLKILAGISDRLAGLSTPVRRQRGAELADRLAPVLALPYLHPWWQRPLVAPGATLNGPAPHLEIYLPPTDLGEHLTIATRRFGFYLLACIIGAAQERQDADRPVAPLLLVLEDGAGWWAGSLLSAYLSCLADAGITVLTTCRELPTGPLRTRLLDNAATWWLHSLTAADAQALIPRLRDWGVTADLPLTRLPPGVAVLKMLASAGPLVTTVYTHAPRSAAGLLPLSTAP